MFNHRYTNTSKLADRKCVVEALCSFFTMVPAFILSVCSDGKSLGSYARNVFSNFLMY